MLHFSSLLQTGRWAQFAGASGSALFSCPPNPSLSPGEVLWISDPANMVLVLCCFLGWCLREMLLPWCLHMTRALSAAHGCDCVALEVAPSSSSSLEPQTGTCAPSQPAALQGEESNRLFLFSLSSQTFNTDFKYWHFLPASRQPREQDGKPSA